MGHESDAEAGSGSPAAEQTTVSEEKFLAALEQIEISRELLESLNLELGYKQQQLQELEQEVIYINQELCTAFRLENISLDEVKALARTILQSNKSTTDSLAELISTIYGSEVELEQLEQKDNFPHSSNS